MSKALGAIVHRFFDQDDHSSTQEMSANAHLLARLDDIERHLSALTQTVEHHMPGEQRSQAARAGDGMAPPTDLAQETASVEALSALERQIARAGREQLKANTLAEAQREQLAAALEELRTVGARREMDLDALREQLRLGQIAARLELARSLLPAIDGLDEALRSGRQVLERPWAPAPARFGWLRGERAPDPDTRTAKRDMESWLVGVGYVRERLLATLAAEGIRPMTALGQPFDPQLHMAMEVTPAAAETPAGTVTAVIRQGYLAGERVLRHAEVAVARAAEAPGGTV
ncbi:MAG TPA: nucleotide exchange factor GrpE [Chloroflexota bacterium]|nr:nucleotide exchange factor GrpE [Chloroflexota bacterium]